ncbi:MAG: exosortase-associated EpsI family protein [Gemmata sp.]
MSAHTPPARPAHAPGGAALRRWLVVGAAVVGLAVAAVVEGRWTNRWGASAELQEVTARLGGVPAVFGDWTGENVPLDEKVLRVAEATGYVQRNYTSRKNGSQLTVLLLCGPSGPIGAHTPEVCYAGNGFAMLGEADKRALALPNQSPVTYWSGRFEKKAPPSTLRVCWMWGNDGDWEASDNARFGLRASLYKLYVVRNEPEPPDSARDPVAEFLTAFLPEVKKALAPRPTAAN